VTAVIRLKNFCTIKRSRKNN